MDASLCALNLQTMELLWAGANNPLWIYRSNEKRLEEVKPDKQPIGKTHDPGEFTTHKLFLSHGDIIYLFTDGFADQFGGEKNKKLTKSVFRALLQDIAHLNMEEQKTRLLNFYTLYKGTNEQIDDVCVIGVRL
jgi:serine phosphatase RsbU (regulator of sigma subunit)